jgi:DNA processing protein
MSGEAHQIGEGGREQVTALALDPKLAWAEARRALAAGLGPVAPIDVAAALGTLARLGGRLVALPDPDFPQALRGLPAGPVGLFVRGTLPPTAMLGIVGARACSRAAADLAHDLAADAVRAGFAVVSGGAVGIDAAAHEGALAAGGSTVAVLGSGLDRPYPQRNVALFDRIAAHGAVATPFPPGTAPLRGNFPRRNVIVAALAERVLVVEARGRSGALLTAQAARTLGRPVAAVPGTVGCDRILAGGARRVETAADLAAWLRGEAPRPAEVHAPTPEAEAALGACDSQPRSVADIAARAGLAEDDARTALAFLVLWGLVVETRSQNYVRVIETRSTTPTDSRRTHEETLV